MKADLKARAQLHHFPRYYQCNQMLGKNRVFVFLSSAHVWLDRMYTLNWTHYLVDPRMCDRCLASQGTGCPVEMLYKNFSPTKAWDLTLIDRPGYVLRERLSLSPWLCMEGFQIERMSYDFLHNMYLGTGRDFFASGLKTLVEWGVYRDTGLTQLDDILCHIEHRIRAKCKERKLLSLVINRALSVFRFIPFGVSGLTKSILAPCFNQGFHCLQSPIFVAQP